MNSTDYYINSDSHIDIINQNISMLEKKVDYLEAQAVISISKSKSAMVIMSINCFVIV